MNPVLGSRVSSLDKDLFFNRDSIYKMAQQGPVPGILLSECTESQYRGDILPTQRSLATQNINPALPEGYPLSDNNVVISETDASLGLSSSSMPSMGVSCGGDYATPRPSLPTGPSSDAIDPLLSPSLSWPQKSPVTVSAQVRSLNLGSDISFEQVNVERDDLESSRSDFSMPSPYIAHSDHGRYHSMTPMLSSEPSGKISPPLVS